MANNGRITRGSIPRALQYGLDTIIDQNGKDYQGEGDKLFEQIDVSKGYWELMQLAGMGVAALLGEGDAITYDSIDQHWVTRVPVQTIEKSARITRNMIKDNVYENLLPRIAREQLKSLAHARDIYQGNVLNRAFTSGYTYGDGLVLCSTAHTLQSGSTSSNRLAADTDFSEDALESMKQLIDKFKNDDGLISSYEADTIVYPVELQFEVSRVVDNPMRPATADRDINASYRSGVVKNKCMWKRLSDTDAYFLTTNAEKGLIMLRREGIFTQTSQDPYTYDTILSAAERYWPTVGDWRCVVGTPGA